MRIYLKLILYVLVAGTTVMLLLPIIQLWDTGSHGKIGLYEFSVPHSMLQQSIDSFLIQHPVMRVTDSLLLRSRNNRYNDIFIVVSATRQVQFTYQYYGDSTYWNSNPASSRLMIVDARLTGYTQYPNTTYNEGDKLLNEEVRREIRNVFQRGFIDKLNEVYDLKGRQVED